MAGFADDAVHRDRRRPRVPGGSDRDAGRDGRAGRDVRRTTHQGPPRRHDDHGGRGSRWSQRRRRRARRCDLRVQQRRRRSTRAEFDGKVLPGRFDPARYIGGRIQRVDPRSGTVTDLYTECDGRPLRAPNDLVMDGHGGFWFTDHGIRDHNARTSRSHRDLLRQGRRVSHPRGGVPGRGSERHRPVARR